MSMPTPVIRRGDFADVGLELDTSVRYLPGVGPSRFAHLSQAGIQSVLDLLLISPSRYELQPAMTPIEQWREGEVVCLVGEITQVRLSSGSRVSRVVAKVRDGTGTCRLTWFNMPQLRHRLRAGMGICATGRVQWYDTGLQLTHPKFRVVDDAEAITGPSQDEWRPVYAAQGPIQSFILTRIISSALDRMDGVVDYLPDQVRKSHSLIVWSQAVDRLHRPGTLEEAEAARRRLAYDELLVSQIELNRAKTIRARDHDAPVFHATPEIDLRIRRRFPFTLTEAQDRAVREIGIDLGRHQPMYRLLQGDVGSGKTVVAVYAALTAIAHRHQVVLLAPTEILAQQHYDKISRYLSGSRVTVALASGSQSNRQRREFRAGLAEGRNHFVVGTHALLEEDVRFHQLGLVIIDEQHRFGVHQREALKSKGRSPHYLVLSATPIPRTQALVWLGEVDISTLDAMPAGRGSVTTRLVTGSTVSEAWTVIRRELDRGHRAYVVYPIIDESENLPLKAVKSEYENLVRGELSGYRCGLLHGRLRGDEKIAVLESFRAGRIQALICTTVVEVGMDVPEATVMAVFHAERYGLAQLHQLRGRIGRGSADAWFLMITDAVSDSALRRLRVLETTRDGFKIAEADLESRGPGELLGTRQHGLLGYRFANLIADRDLLEMARHDARRLMDRDVVLSDLQRVLLMAIRRSLGVGHAELFYIA